MFLDGLLLRFVHYVIALGTFIYQCMTSRWNKPLNRILYRKRTLGRISADVGSLKKLPLHMSCVVLERDLSFVDLANIVVWSMAIGISYISIYDPEGEIKRNSKILEDLIEQKNRETLEGSVQFDIYVHNSKTKSDTLDRACCSSKPVKISLLSLEDGRQNLVELTKDLCRRVSHKTHRLDDIVPNNVDKMLKDQHAFPDPDLVLRFGNISSLLGFMPWEMRLAEILSVPSHQGLDYTSFMTLLLQYGSMQQRFGK